MAWKVNCAGPTERNRRMRFISTRERVTTSTTSTTGMVGWLWAMDFGDIWEACCLASTRGPPRYTLYVLGGLSLTAYIHALVLWYKPEYMVLAIGQRSLRSGWCRFTAHAQVTENPVLPSQSRKPTLPTPLSAARLSPGRPDSVQSPSHGIRN